MILSTLDTINDRIAGQLNTSAVEVGGMAIPFADQQEKDTSLRLIDSNRRFVLNNKLVWQSAHLADGSTVVDKKTFGSFTDHTHNVRFILIGVSKAKSGMDVAMRALDGTGYVVIDSHESDTLTVLSRYFRVKTGQDKNYDPDLFAFAIRYHLTGVTDADFAEMPDAQDLAELPVVIPEPEPTLPPNPNPGTGTGGTGYTHTQSSSASVWTVVHNLGYRPGGIAVFDTAGSQWFYEVEHQDTNTLKLRFGTFLLAGTAYLS